MLRNIKTIKASLLIVFTFTLLSLLLAPLAVVAADAGLVAPAAPSASPSPFTALIPLAVPVFIAVLKAFIPNIPGVWLPIIAPVLGAAADIVMHYASVSTLGPLWGAVMGSAGVGLRELQDQLKQAVLPSRPPAPASNQ